MKNKILGLAVALVMAFHSAPSQAQEFINVLTGGTGGVYYPLGVQLANVFAKAMPGVKAAAQSTKGSVENLNLLQAGRGELAFTLGDTLTLAWNGDADAGFPQKLDKLRGVALIYPNYVQLVASKSSGIKTLADLKGKRIAVGAPKSGTELNTRALLKAVGLTYNDFAKVEYLPFNESIDLIKNRQLDVTLISAGLGVSAIRDLAVSIDIVMVPIPREVVAKIGDPAYLPASIPAHTYNGQDADVPAIAIQNFLVTRADVKAETVYAMLKAMYDNLDLLAAAHSAAKNIKLADGAKGMPIPFHPGAEKFFRDKGVLK